MLQHSHSILVGNLPICPGRQQPAHGLYMPRPTVAEDHRLQQAPRCPARILEKTRQGLKSSLCMTHSALLNR